MLIVAHMWAGRSKKIKQNVQQGFASSDVEGFPYERARGDPELATADLLWAVEEWIKSRGVV